MQKKTVVFALVVAALMLFAAPGTVSAQTSTELSCQSQIDLCLLFTEIPLLSNPPYNYFNSACFVDLFVLGYFCDVYIGQSNALGGAFFSFEAGLYLTACYFYCDLALDYVLFCFQYIIPGDTFTPTVLQGCYQAYTDAFNLCAQALVEGGYTPLPPVF